jgi:cytochrome c-type biogenesis protein CcmH/NrfG
VAVAGATGVPREAPAVAESGRPAPRVARTRRPRLGPVGRVLVAAGALALVVGVGYGVYAAGPKPVPGFTGTPAPEVSASPAIDQAKVADLMQKITANAKDTASLLELGNIYFDAGDYKTSADFMSKVVALDPKNVDALVALGAATFNQGDSSGAEAEWRKAIAVDPKKQEAYYDLGFMYLSANPPDMANVTAMWTKVLEIDPTTPIAQTVKTHLDSFASSASPAPSASGPAAPAASGGTSSPAASADVASPAASATAVPSAAPSASASGGN